MKSVKSAKGMRKWFEIIMRAIWGSIAALLVGLTRYRPRIRQSKIASKISREMTPMDKGLDADENLFKAPRKMGRCHVFAGRSNLCELGSAWKARRRQQFLGLAQSTPSPHS